MELPATEAIRPLTRASALGVDDVVVDVTTDVEVEVEVDVGLDLFEEPQADRDKAVAPATANTAKRVSRGTLADINVSPFVG
ncbi:hypothetical protein A5687_16505 [Mycobacterium mantenii]|uniref:Uncharacterized protein n=1 Tax=Mycobacterium mantenii TaxID=560555 RepID=A0A1A2TJ67_MYCNT|nr:hypothetical protein [Mycobacterium mantenii]OBH47657.1 hypothetical protein A5687_16505 [Mycobacterium mantenii]OBH50513.1 hypothetical protein A5688_21325 [Mycobacterium mantenii]OBH76405.1 hypothetical protein A5683_20945 [Mycobacterium mantenii]